MFDFKKRLVTIECPKCGRQYLPAEIYIPNAFFGKPSEIERTNTGKIEMFDGTSLDPVEEYVCDTCNTKFKVVATIGFKSSEVDPKKSFNSVYSTQIHTKKISLFEGN